MAVRERLFIDKEVQGALVARVVIYWLAGIAYVILGSVGTNLYTSPNWTISQHFSHMLDTYWAWIPSALLILPLVIYDVVRLSNKFAGPIYRLRSHLQRSLDNPAPERVQFRGDDFWRDLADPVNELQRRIVKLQDEVVDLQTQLHEARLLIPSLRNTPKPSPKKTPAGNVAEPRNSAEQGRVAEQAKTTKPTSTSAASQESSARTQSGTALLDEANA
ncbi:MAG: hypothetical protein Aurels2KO_21330 [Aureliella sp.]